MPQARIKESFESAGIKSLSAYIWPFFRDVSAQVEVGIDRNADDLAIVFSLAMTAQVRQGAVVQAERKAAQGTPAYLYWFTWKTPALDGTPRSIHSCDLPFCFDNTDLHENLTGGGPEPRALAARVSEAWIHFARFGDPNYAGLPHWPAFSKESCPTMIFDTQCKSQHNPDKKERQVLAKSPPFLELGQ